MLKATMITLAVLIMAAQMGISLFAVAFGGQVLGTAVLGIAVVAPALLVQAGLYAYMNRNK